MGLDEGAGSSGKAETDRSQHTTKGLRAPILIVDDDPANLYAFREVLQDPRHDLVVAASGQEAINLAERRDFAVILLDVRMPILNGYDTAALIRRRPRSKATPILFMTAFEASAQEVSDAYGVGGTDFIRKPVEDVVLRSKVATYVDLYLDRLEARAWAKDLTEMTDRRLRLIFEQMPVNLCTVNRDLRITFADGQSVRARGKGGDEIIGRPVTDFVDEADRPKVERVFRESLEGRATSYETRFEGRVYSAHVQPLMDRNKAIIGAICGFLDVTEQKEAEQKSLEQKNLLEAFFRATPDAVFVKDTTGHVLLINQSGAELFGKTVEAVAGLEDHELLPEPVARKCREGDRRVLETGQPLVTEEHIPFPDGIHTFRLSKAPQRDPAGTIVGIVAVAHDVTDLIRAREKLVETNERFRLAMRATNDVIYDWDPARDRVVVSGAAGTILGLLGLGDSSEPITIDQAQNWWLNLIHPDDREDVWKSFEAAFGKGEHTWSHEYRLVTPDGRIAWMLDRAIILRDLEGNPQRVVGSFLEITRRKESEERLSTLNRELESRILERTASLRESQTRLGLALDGGGMGTWDLDTQTGGVRWSEMMGNLLGYGQTQVSPSLEAWRVRLHPEDRERVLAEVERVKREGGPYRIDYRISRADTSEVRWLSSRAKCTIDDQGKVIRFSGVTFDATELRSAQDLLRGALEEANAFARNVSHELRAPLRAITMTAQLLLDEYAWRPVDLEGQAQFGRLIDAARRLDAMTEDLLAYSRMAQEQMALGPVDLETILGKVLADMKDDLAQRRAEVRLEGPFPRIQGHACTLYHALTNLLYNAIKFVAPDTTPCVNIRPERREGWVRLWVEDNGIGISPPDQVRLFQVFERLSPEYPGTGIGLALVRKGIERMGGKTGVESEPGKGSRFWIELPSSADSPAGPPS